MAGEKLDLVTFKGSDRECGRQYGETFETRIMGFCRQEVKPDAARLRYAARCWKYVEQFAPKSAAFMKGMAEGSRLSIEHIALLSLHEEIVHMPVPPAPTPHCTAFVATGAATRQGRTINAMNWDWNTNLYPWAGLLRLDAKGSPCVVTYHYPGLWAGAGINEAGVSFMWTGSGYHPRIPPVVGVPTYVIIAEMLRRKSVADVLTFLKSIKHAGSFIFFLGDARGHIAVVEGCPGRLHVDQSDVALTRANHYECAVTMRKSKQHAVLGGTTCYRAARMAEMVAARRGSIDVAAAKAMLTDRDGPGPYVHQYPCGSNAHELGGLTIDSLFAVSEDRVLWTCRGGRVPGPWRSVAV